MAHIMLTDSCNLKCPYCFANEFVNKKVNEIIPENFNKALDFVLRARNGNIGLIGGEPTICSNFRKYLVQLEEDSRVNQITIFTNGVYLDKFMDIIMHPKVSLLINCNRRDYMGDVMYERMLRNIDKLAELNGNVKIKNFCLGCNFWDYEHEEEYDYLIDLTSKYQLNVLRFSILVPDFTKEQNSLEYFEKRHSFMMKYFIKCLDNGVYPHFDCNNMVPCILTDDDMNVLRKHAKNKKMFRENIPNNYSYCEGSGPIDIRPDLTAIRCFGLSHYKVKITDFNSYKELCEHFINHFNKKYDSIPLYQQCESCKYHKAEVCNGGCYGFKVNNKVVQFKVDLENLKKNN